MDNYGRKQPRQLSPEELKEIEEKRSKGRISIVYLSPTLFSDSDAFY
jgi:hypothetical protein